MWATDMEISLLSIITRKSKIKTMLIVITGQLLEQTL